MFDQEDSELNVVMGVLFGVVALVIAFVIGLGVHSMGRNAVVAEPSEASAPVSEVAYAEVEEVGAAMLNIYFEAGSSRLSDDSVDGLAPVLAALEAKPEAVVLLSGFHDETGSAVANAVIAKERAMAVREALLAARVPAERVLLRRPAVALGGSDSAQARRVEVRVQ